MLEELIVRNLGIIEEARLEPGPGLVVISGETGTGKTLLLGALDLLRGAVARSNLIGPHGDETSVEGRFTIGGEEIVVARRLLSEGRNRTYLDGSAVPARTVEERLAGLIEMVGQHDHLAITRTAEVRDMLDRSLDPEGRDRLAEYRTAWVRFDELLSARQRLGEDPSALEREAEMLALQVREIEGANLGQDEEGELRRQADRLRHAEELGAALALVLNHLRGEGAVADRLGSVVAELRRTTKLDPGLERLAERAGLAAEEINELSRDLREEAESIELNPSGLAAVEERLSAIARLRRKYGEDVRGVLEYGRRASWRLEELKRVLAEAAGLEGRLEEARAGLERLGEDLRESRRQAAHRLAQEAVDHLRHLGFTEPVVELSIEPGEPTSAGADVIRLSFASDASLPPGPVSRVASGGELSRLVLSLRLAGGSGKAPVVVFDEVDAGVGGSVALELGRKLAALAESRQVLCVTHLPQVAAFADDHFVIERMGGKGSVRRVEGDERLEEISRMLSGLPESQRGRDHAQELLGIGQRA